MDLTYLNERLLEFTDYFEISPLMCISNHILIMNVKPKIMFKIENDYEYAKKFLNWIADFILFEYKGTTFYNSVEYSLIFGSSVLDLKVYLKGKA